MEYVKSYKTNGEEYVTVFDPALKSPLIATDQHPRYAEITEALANEETTLSKLESLFDLSVGLAEVLNPLTERVTVGNGRVYFDGDQVHDVIADHIVRALKDLDEAKAQALAWFLEELAANPSERSREQLYSWLETADFSIEWDGSIIAYKGVTEDLHSMNGGKAIVDGKPHAGGPVPNEPGSTIEFPRSEVVDNAAVGCATGLHVGTWDYANEFGPRTLKVLVSARDVVSVPTDCDAQKVRVCRYRVIEEIDAPETEAFTEEPEAIVIGPPAEEPEPGSQGYSWELAYRDDCGHWNHDDGAEPVKAANASQALALLEAQEGLEPEFHQAVRWTDIATGEKSDGWVVYGPATEDGERVWLGLTANEEATAALDTEL